VYAEEKIGSLHEAEQGDLLAQLDLLGSQIGYLGPDFLHVIKSVEEGEVC